MDATDYHRDALRTAVAHASPAHRLANAALGLAGEAGEVARHVADAMSGDRVVGRALAAQATLSGAIEHLKKVRFHGRALDAGLLRRQLAQARQEIARLEAAIEGEYLHGPPDPAGLELNALPVGALVDEAGDVAWYLPLLLDALGVNLDDALGRNVQKLRARYPDGFRAEGER